MATDALHHLQQASDQIVDLFVQALTFDRQGRLTEAKRSRDRGGVLFDQHLASWFESRFRRCGLDEGEAQDQTQEAFTKLYVYLQKNPVRSNAFGLICRMQRSIFADWLRHKKAQRRSAKHKDKEGKAIAAEVQLDEDEWTELMQTHAGAGGDPMHGLRNCVERKLAEMEIVAPTYVEVLELAALRLSAREIAAVIYDKPEADVSKREEGNMRSRVNEARNKARVLFAECRD